MKHLLFTLCAILLLGLSSCYYDNEEDLYPVEEPPACDTMAVSYSAVVYPIFESRCISCHNNSGPSGNINLEDFSQVQTIAQNGRLYGSLAHLSGYSPMPKNENQLGDCPLAQVKSWVDAGAPNN